MGNVAKWNKEFEKEIIIDRIESKALINILMQAKNECCDLFKKSNLSQEDFIEKSRSIDISFNNFIKEFKVNELKEVILVSKYPYDLIINSGENSSFDIAKKIQDFINK